MVWKLQLVYIFIPFGYGRVKNKYFLIYKINSTRISYKIIFSINQYLVFNIESAHCFLFEFSGGIILKLSFMK